jgi:hypothetical protein
MVRLMMIVHFVIVGSDSVALGFELASNMQTMPKKNPQTVATITRFVVNIFFPPVNEKVYRLIKSAIHSK